jgi:two-component system CheB/CheR fusion protein
VKNILAVVQGLVHQTARATASKEEFAARLDGRLAALAYSHSLLVDSEWAGADLHKLVETELEAYAGDLTRFHVKGEAVSLPANVATPFGLVLHELATNAIKYGALSNGTGHVDLAWSVRQVDHGPVLEFHWREVEGPPVKKPLSQGFGSNLIRRGLPGASVEHEFRPDGVTCTIALPIPPATKGGLGGSQEAFED